MVQTIAPQGEGLTMLRKSPNKADAVDNEDIGEADMAKAEADETAVEIDKDFVVVALDQSVVWRAKEALFNTNIEQCEALVRDKYLTNPWAMCMYSEAALWRFVFERKTEDWEVGIMRTKAAAAQAAVLQKRYKTRVSKADGDKCALYVEAMAMEANAHLSMSILHLIQKNFVKGAYYIRKSWKGWEACEKLVRELAAAGAPVPRAVEGLVSFGVGFFYFFISLVPANLQFLVKLLGFAGDRMRAYELLDVVRGVPESGKSVESSLIVFILFFWFMDERERAPAILDELKVKLPASPVMHLTAGWQALVTDHNTDLAIECYTRAESMTQLAQLQVACRAQLAYAHFLREDWVRVKELLTDYMKNTATTETKSYSAFSLGLANYMLNHNAECAEWMRKCVEWEDKTSNWDAYSVTVARLYLANGDKFDRCTLLYLLIENANEAGQGERALKYCDEVDTLKEWGGFTQDDKLAMSSYFRGCALRLQKQLEPAKSQLIRAAGMHGKPLSLEARRAVPYALVVLGEMYLREFNQLDNAARFFSKAQNYKDKFLFSDILAFRLKSNNEVLEAKRKKPQPVVADDE